MRYMLVSGGAVTNSGAIHLGSYSVRTFHLLLTKEMYPVSTLVVWCLDTQGILIAQHITFPVFETSAQVTVSSFLFKI